MVDQRTCGDTDIIGRMFVCNSLCLWYVRMHVCCVCVSVCVCMCDEFQFQLSMTL